jgi:hypothetical protein
VNITTVETMVKAGCITSRPSCMIAGPA